MKRIFALSILSLFFAAAGCGAGPDVSSTPETSALAQKLTHDVHMSKEPLSGDPVVSAEVTSKSGAYSNITVIVRCDRRCIMACTDSEDFCTASCCDVIVR